MLTPIKEQDLRELAEKCGLRIQHECGGFRVTTHMNSNVFPDAGICPTVTKRKCWIFLLGYLAGKKNLAQT